MAVARPAIGPGTVTRASVKPTAAAHSEWLLGRVTYTVALVGWPVLLAPRRRIRRFGRGQSELTVPG